MMYAMRNIHDIDNYSKYFIYDESSFDPVFM